MLATDPPRPRRCRLYESTLLCVIGGFLLSLSLTSGGCSASLVSVEGLPCDGGACLEGYVCHPQTDTCVRGTGGSGGNAGTSGSGGTGGSAGSGGSAGTGGGCPVCTDYYRDDDRDGVGLLADSQCLCAPVAPYDTAVSGDCDDTDSQCATSCIDGDGDGFCAGIDCYDADNTCTTDCSTCPPKTLTLTITTPGPINPSDNVSLEIDLGTYRRDASAELSCTTTAQVFDGPHDFGTCPPAGWVDNRADCRVETVGPFNRTECNGTGDYLELRSSPNARVELDPGIDTAAYTSPTLSFVAAVANGYAGSDLLAVRACCGNGCNLGGGVLVATITPADIGDTQSCSTQSVVLPFAGCSNLRARLEWDNFGPTVGVDDLILTAPLLVSAPVAGSPGIYTATLTAGVLGTVDVTCTWDNPGIGTSVDDTQPLIVQ